MKTETNVFPILNLSELTHQYRIFDIRGLKKDDYQNRQMVVNRLSRELKHPVLIIEDNEQLKLVVKQDVDTLNKVPKEYDLVGGSAYFNLTEKIFDLDFTSKNQEIRKICQRFLQFDLQGEFKKNFKLWQPGTGRPFFSKEPEIFGNVLMYSGFYVRVMELANGFGLVIDATVKFAKATPIPAYMSKNEFRYFKDKTVIYQFGHSWYEVKLKEVEELNVSEYKIEGTPLIDYIRNQINKPHSQLLANLPNDSSTLIYYEGTMPKRLPAGLCFEVLDFQDIRDVKVKKNSIMFPHIRWNKIKDWFPFANSLKFGKNYLKIARQPLRLDLEKFDFPSFELGNNYILEPSDFISPKDLASKRLQKINEKEIGFYTNTPLPNHFIALPRSIFDTRGADFVKMLSKTVNSMYPHDEYNPEVIFYEDKFRNGTDYVSVGKTIIKAIESKCMQPKPSYGLIMIPNLEKKKKKDHDKLSALLIRELDKQKFKCSTIHTDMVQDCLIEYKDREGKVCFKVSTEKLGKFNGYLKNISINKILLTCQKYPFVLATPLAADLTIGIDVKHNTAGFSIVDRYAKTLKSEIETTGNKERLSLKQLKARLYRVVNSFMSNNPNYNIENIVIHRDGRVFDTEITGIMQGLEKLKEDDILPINATISIIEIHKSSFLPMRLFGLSLDTFQRIVNPSIGTHYIYNDDAFICTTGKEFRHDGTTNPLYVKFIKSNLPKKEILHDLFKLSTLAFTKPDDCSRYPITVKLNDLKLSDAASEYDRDELEWEFPVEEINLN